MESPTTRLVTNLTVTHAINYLHQLMACAERYRYSAGAGISIRTHRKGQRRREIQPATSPSSLYLLHGWEHHGFERG